MQMGHGGAMQELAFIGGHEALGCEGVLEQEGGDLSTHALTLSMTRMWNTF